MNGSENLHPNLRSERVKKPENTNLPKLPNFFVTLGLPKREFVLMAPKSKKKLVSNYLRT